MKKTLQDQYLLIKEGKGHKGVFLADAKRDFPHIVPNHATFDEAAASLKTKNIISENVIGLSAVAGYEPRKKETYETAFEAFLAEARKVKENEDEKVKAEEKKVSKPVEKDLEKNFDYSDDKNPDNLIFDQIMMGYYAEMKDPKNADKTMQQLKDIVLKNLAKDPIHYTKDGQFGVKDLGYVTEHPGLGTPKEPKGKYASSGYGNLSEGMEGTDSLERTARIALERLKVASSLSLKDYTRQELIDALRRASEDRFGNEKLDNLADQLEATLEEAKESWKDRFTEKPSEPKFSDEEKEADRKKKREAELERRRKAGESLEEITLRRAIQEMIDAELGEAYQLVNIRPQVSDKEREERDPQPFITVYLAAPTEELMKKNQHLRVLRDPQNPEEIKGVAIRSRLLSPQNLKKLPYDINPMFVGFLNTANNIGGKINLPTKEGVTDDYILLNNVNVGRDGRLSFKTPNPKFQKPMEEILRESVEKDLAAINKEAEHEVLQSKLDKIDVLIDKRKSQLGKLDEDEDMKALTDKKKVKELQKDIKKLEQAKAKVEKIIGKTKSKKKEVIDETDAPDNLVSDIPPGYIQDAEERLRDGESIDSIIGNYPNLSFEDKNNLRSFLTWQQDSDIGQAEELEEGFLGNIFSKKDEELESMMQEADELAAETGKPHYVMAGSYGRYVTDNPSGKSGEQIYSTEEFE